jgi:hypothetical protein
MPGKGDVCGFAIGKHLKNTDVEQMPYFVHINHQNAVACSGLWVIPGASGVGLPLDIRPIVGVVYKYTLVVNRLGRLPAACP